MTGHRKRLGKPTRADARHARMCDQLLAATDAQQQVALAFDWWRTAAQQTDPARRLQLLREMADELMARAMEISGWSPPDSEIWQKRAAAAEQDGGYPA